jgi:hypothetical protein
MNLCLWQEFLRKEKEVPMPHLDCLVVFSRQDPFVIPTVRKEREVVGRMTSLSMVSTTNQGVEQPYNRELRGVGIDERSIDGTSRGILVQPLMDNSSMKA